MYFFSHSCKASTYQLGLDAVKQKNYSLAVEYFNQSISTDAMHAETVGADTKTKDKLSLVYYNLGVCYYRLALYDSAINSFKQAMLSDMLLWRSVFNLALIGEKQQRLSYAIKLYNKIIIDSENPELIVLANRNLKTLSQVTLPPQAETIELTSHTLPKVWAGIVSAGSGQETNIIDPQDFSGSGSHDNFNEVYAGIYKPLFVEGNRHLIFDASVYTLRYKTIDDYDTTLVNVGLKQQWQLRRQLLSAGLFIEHSTVGNDDYLLQRTFFASNSWTLASKSKLKLNYHYRDFDALDPGFNPLNGSRQQLKLSWHSPRINNHRWKTHIFVIDDKREDRSVLNINTSYSSFRQGVYAAWDYRDGRWYWLVNVEFRNSHYDGRNTLGDFTEKTRDDDRLKAGINLQYFISRHWAFNIEYRHIDNQSNIKNYDYRGTVTTASINYEF